MSNRLGKMAGVAGLAAVAGTPACMPQPDQQVTIDVVGINGRSGDTDLAVVVERRAEEANNSIEFREVKGADLSVAETTVRAVRDDVTVVHLSVLPDGGGRVAVAAPLRTNGLVTGGTSDRYVAVSTEDGAYDDVGIACELFRAEQIGVEDAGEDPDDRRLIELGDAFPLPVVTEFIDAEGELAAGGFNLREVALHDLAGTVGSHVVLECKVDEDSQRTNVVDRGGDGDDDDSSDAGDDDDDDDDDGGDDDDSSP